MGTNKKTNKRYLNYSIMRSYLSFYVVLHNRYKMADSVGHFCVAVEYLAEISDYFQKVIF